MTAAVSNRSYRPPRAALEELAPRSARPDPRADPDEDGLKPPTSPPLRNSGRIPTVRARESHERLEAARGEQVETERAAAADDMTRKIADLEEENRAAARRVAELESERDTLERRSEALLDEARAAIARATRADQRVSELEKELARKQESEALLELLAEGQITEKERLRGQTEEIQALRLAVDCARAENLALQARLGNERAHKERLLDEVARVQTLLDDLKRLAR
jgi:chromosome segregation ATPase